MSDVKSFGVSKDLYLIRQKVPSKAPAKPVEVPVNHIAVIDCSGSMSYDLPRIREQLKKRLPKLLKESDTISIVWFSGRGQFGTLLEAEPVATLADLQAVNQAIDRWLKPVCLTGFKEPLEEVEKLVGRIKGKKDSVFALFFMSDGCDNQWSRPEILKAVEKVGGKLAAATFVEYGYYADRPLLTAMAEKAGGSLIFADGFDKYTPMFEAAMQRKPVGGKKVALDVSGDPVGGFVYALDGSDLLTFAVEGGQASVPEGLPEVWYLAPKSIGKPLDCMSGFADAAKPNVDNETLGALPAAYAALSLFSVRMLPDVVLPLLKATGDVAFIDRFAGLFGKQRYSEFMDAAREATFDAGKRLTKGYDPAKVPPDDAFTVLDLLRILSEDDGCRVLLDHEDFKYNKISRGRIDSSEVLSDEEQAEVAKLTAEMVGTKDAKKIKAIGEKIAAITAGKEALKFVADPAPEGYSISNLTYNEEKPNISILVRKSGKVDLSARLPENFKAAVPAIFPTFVYRNYAVVKDGLVNVEKLPVVIPPKVYYDLLKKMPEGSIHVATAKMGVSVTAVLDLSGLPIINRQMVKSVSAKEMFEKQHELTRLRAGQKVYNTVKKEKFPRKSEGFVEFYGEEAATWLKEQGLTDYSGFSPKGVQAEARDFYMAKELVISLAGLSSIPSLKEARTKIAASEAAKGTKKEKPLTPSLALIAPFVKEVDDYLGSDAYKKAGDPDKAFEEWIDKKAKETTKAVRRLISELAQTRFAIVVGQTWPKEFKSIDEDSLDITVAGQKISGKLTMREVKVEI